MLVRGPTIFHALTKWKIIVAHSRSRKGQESEKMSDDQTFERKVMTPAEREAPSRTYIVHVHSSCFAHPRFVKSDLFTRRQLRRPEQAQ